MNSLESTDREGAARLRKRTYDLAALARTPAPRRAEADSSAGTRSIRDRVTTLVREDDSIVVRDLWTCLAPSHGGRVRRGLERVAFDGGPTRWGGSGGWQGCSGVGNWSRSDGSRGSCGLDPRRHEEAGMGLFRRKPEVDAELESRVDRLQSECRQARLHCQLLPDGADKQNRLKDLEVAEQAVAEARAEGDKTARIRAALKAEAELCLTKSVPLLVRTANRLREKLYRLDSKRREEAWGKYLDG